MCEILDQQVGRKFHLQAKEMPDTTENRTNKASNSNAGNVNNCINTPDYFRCSMRKQTKKQEDYLQ